MAEHYTILVGSVLGASEYVAEALVDVLTETGAEAEIQFTPDLEQICEETTWIICTSTHGAGELPDNIQPFAEQLSEANLSGVEAYIIGLGDSSYDTFCFGASTMAKILTEQGAHLITDPLKIDVLNHPIPEDVAKEWLEEQLK